MPKPYTLPTLFDEVFQIHISQFKNCGYLQEGKIKYDSIIWKVSGKQIASVTVFINMDEFSPYIRLSYTAGGNPREYKVSLEWIQSNLGKGKVWYFRCPHTYKRCRKLYMVDGYFLHREANRHGMYYSQTMSKTIRGYDQIFKNYAKRDELLNELQSKYFKTHYRGRPTRRYLRLMRELEKADYGFKLNLESLLKG